MMLEEEQLRSELVFSVPKAMLLCPSTAEEPAGVPMDATEPAAGTGAALSQANLISYFSRKAFFLFQEKDSKHCSLDFPFQEKPEKIKICILLRKRGVPLSTAPDLLKSQHFCLSLSSASQLLP